MRSILILLLGFLAAGCGREEVKVYRVAKEQPASAPKMPGPGSLPSGHPDLGTPAPPQATWKTPDGWTEMPAGEMRVASFKVNKDGKQADVSVIPLPGVAGGDFANVNRWRGQVGLQPVTEEELKKVALTVESGGLPANLYDVAGTNPASGDATRILGAIQHRDDVAWFFKMTGDDTLVEQQKPAFVEFLKSVRFEAPDTAALPPAHPAVEGGTLPAGHPDVSRMSAPAVVPSGEGRPNWQVPPGWNEVAAGQFLVAKFAIAGDGGGQAAVNVSMSAGDGGGWGANVNRWRRQLGLGELSEPEVSKLATSVEIAGGKAMFVDLTGTDARTGQPTRLVGAMVSQSAQSWFYKLMGDAMVVEAQKEAFTRFVQTAKY